ncbi:GNAT family N-acetyltransferase [Nonomuraea sp. NPDC050790]|uniref:GNAT family N-acetyltransferase n=1 Tax=Nonomuraea sp. NPDC050790 TaxID=3364371 RepID=UPI0037BA51F6
MLWTMAEHLTIRSIHGTAALERADRLLREVWRTSRGEDPPIPLDLMCAFAHTGGYVGGAFLDDELVGAAAGFLAAGRTLHSHVAGVSALARGRGVGRALKDHQRAWAAERGLDAVSWTFDPLVRRNAYFNLSRLGARVGAYLPDFYGPMSDGINDGGPSDRLFVTWPTQESPAPAPVSGDEGIDVVTGTGVVCAARNAPLLRCATPPDVESLRAADPRAARRWREALAEGLGGALERGYRVTGFTRSGWYLLARGGAA